MSSTYYEKGVTSNAPYQATQQPPSTQDIYTVENPTKTFDSNVRSASVSGCGITTLQQYDHVTVKQQKEMSEAFTGFETANRYSVLGPHGELLLKCGEKSSVVMRTLLRANRPLNIDILDATQQTVMKISKPFKLWKESIAVSDGQGGNLGVIRKAFSVSSKKFLIENACGQVVCILDGGPFFTRKFKILNAAGQEEVGQILKRWGGLTQEIFTDTDTFTCFFPLEADATTRALLVAATLFIDLTHFENKKK